MAVVLENRLPADGFDDTVAVKTVADEFAGADKSRNDSSSALVG